MEFASQKNNAKHKPNGWENMPYRADVRIHNFTVFACVYVKMKQ